MPELPEVETTVKGLQKKVLGRTFLDVWTDCKNLIKRPKDFEQFKKEIKRRKIENVKRRGKNILIGLSGNKTLLIHQKLTGHLLCGIWRLDQGTWKSKIKGPLQERVNTYIHLLFILDDGQYLALSDLRKFAKAELLDKDELREELNSLGPEPLDKSFTFESFIRILGRVRGKIKQILMDQTVIAGIGNIYSDEILWRAKIHPLREISQISEKELKKIYQTIRKTLPLAIKLGGESISDYRTLSGEAGFFDKARKVYRREGEKCRHCGAIIKRIKTGSRSTHFCPNCQKL